MPPRPIAAFLATLVLLLAAGTADANGCRLRTPEAVELVRELITPGAIIVRHCWYCAGPAEPLRIGTVAFEHHAPESVTLMPTGQRFSASALELAEKNGSGPLAAALRDEIEREYTEQGLGDSNDPEIEKEKRSRYQMFLSFTRENHEMGTWDNLLLNGEPADPRLLYVPQGENRYASVGAKVGCDMSDAPLDLVYQPVERDPSTERPPVPYVADVTGQCYDGSCPQPVWTVRAEVVLYDDPGGKGEKTSVLMPGESVDPLEVRSYVQPARGTVTRDHGRFFAGDVFYLLDSQAEGFYRFWHYSDVFIADALDVSFETGPECVESEEHWACVDDYPKATWWARVRSSDGRTGWVRNPLDMLDGVLVQ